MAKKNGKTALIAALLLVHLVGPEAVPQAQIYSAANSKKQAGLIYQAAAAMVRMSADLAQIITPFKGGMRLVCHLFGSFYQALSADGDIEEGISPTLWIYDELGRTKKTALYDSLDNAGGAWEEPLGIIISVQARSPHMLMSELVRFSRKLLSGEEVDPSWSVAIFEVPADADPLDETQWVLANPALGDFKDLEDIRRAAREAKRNPSRMASFKNFQLNQQVDDLVQQIHLKEDWLACGDAFDEEELRDQECFGGLDLSRRIDLSALVLVFPGFAKKRVLLRAWTPEGRLDERAERDQAPYREWIAAGHLIAVPGLSIDYAYIAMEIAHLSSIYRIKEIGFDRWGIERLCEKLDALGVAYWVKGEDDPEDGVLCLVPFGQGFKDMTPAIDQMEIDVMEHRFAHANHPVLTWAASNAVTTSDAAGNRKLAKNKARNRIDPYVALTMANGVATRPVEEPPPPTGSIYDDLDALRAALKG